MAKFEFFVNLFCQTPFLKMKIDLFQPLYLLMETILILREQKNLVSGSVKWQIFLTFGTFAYVYLNNKRHGSQMLEQTIWL